MKVYIKRIKKDIPLPQYGTKYSAGADLVADMEHRLQIKPHETVFIGTGVAVTIPNGYFGLVCARSGLSCKRDLAPANKVGVIDEDYTGEIVVALHNHGEDVQDVEPYERIAQLVIVPYIRADFLEVDELKATKRGNGGFGSTGEA